MKIGIIGAGQIGGTLTRRLTALGHEVFVANSRSPKRSLIWPLKLARPPSPSPKPFAASISSLSPFLRRIFQTCRPVCSPIRLTAWWSSILATTTRANATAASRQLRRVYRRASGSRSSSAGQ
jgi:NADP oxidoreductase coenzyme F420-dependent